MTFWQENYAFIKDVYDSRSSKLVELMDKIDKSIAAILADKIYTSNEFKKIKEQFMGLARNLEQPELKEWLTTTKETLMTDRGSSENDEENKKLVALLARFGETLPKVNDTKNVTDCLWKAYQFTDELAPFMEWIEDMRSKATRELNTDSAAQTEEHIERQEKYLDQMDKKKKSVTDQIVKGEKILADPKSPKFLAGHVEKLRSVWEETSKESENRLAALKENLSAWERYERMREGLLNKFDAAEKEFSATIKVFDLGTCVQEHAARVATAQTMRKEIEETFKTVSEANDILARMMQDLKKAELADEVTNLKNRMNICDSMDEKLKNLDDFNKKLKTFDTNVKEMETWVVEGRKRMDDLLKPPAPMAPEERVMVTMELQADIEKQIKTHADLMEEWNKIQPTEGGEKGEHSEAFVTRCSTVSGTQNSLLSEVKAEGEKFGEDIKYLADFTGGQKKFEPWIQKAEAKRAAGMSKPGNLKEALDMLEDAEKWAKETADMKATMENAYASACKMTLHDEPDVKHTACMKRWEVIEATTKDWIKQINSMVEVWKKQEETAQKVTAAIAAPAGGDGAPMKLEDLEKHLDSLKQMFIEKQKMMEQMEKSAGGAAAPAPAAAAPAAAEAAKPAEPAPAPAAT